jgi:hypothetical protein
VGDEAEEVVQDAEVVDGLPVITESGVVEERASISVPAVQVAALAATGFVAGAATVAVVSRHRTKRAAKKRKKTGTIGEIVSSNSFLIDVHLLRRS